MDHITIVIIDDHPIFRQGVADTLSLEPDFSIVGGAADGLEGMQMLRDLRPQVAIVDINLPGLNGQQVALQAAVEKLPTRIIMLTAYDDTEQKMHAMSAGAFAYCTKDVQPEKLVEIIRRVVNGGLVLGEQEIESRDLERWLDSQGEARARFSLVPGEGFQTLSGREMEVLTYVTRGLSNKEIARALGISHQTVKNHVTAIFRKLGVEDRTQATIYALQRGWVRLDQTTIKSKE